MNLRSGTWLLAIALLTAVGAASCGGASGKATSPGVTAGELNSGDFGAGATFEHRFLTSGTFPYHCIHHSPMTGSVRVGDAVTDTVVNVSITSDAAPFPDATVRLGGRVVLKNNTGTVHTVTSDR